MLGRYRHLGAAVQLNLCNDTLKVSHVEHGRRGRTVLSRSSPDCHPMHVSLDHSRVYTATVIKESGVSNPFDFTESPVLLPALLSCDAVPLTNICSPLGEQDTDKSGEGSG